jgi:YfiH family protein
VFTDRRGGVSNDPYASANLAYSVGDDPRAVGENRRRLAARLGTDLVADPGAWVWMRQVHGARVLRAGRAVASAPGVDRPDAGAPEADALVTTDVGVALGVLVADCAPLALVGERAVAAVHAGWAGLEQGVVAAALDALRGVTTGPIHAVLGPCIRPGAYEFGPDLLARLTARLGPRVVSVTRTGAPALDIPACVRSELAAGGIEHLHDVGICTATSPAHFSYRRDHVTGRQAMVVVRAP